MESLLNSFSVAFAFMKEGYYIDLDWLGEFVKIIVSSVGTVGLGIILFTLILKAITTPFDIYQRVKMRKQTLIMRSMQSDLEKLQKQYANDKTLYNQKMMELQKKNGYSLFGACLPMIISIVILMVAVSAFQSYAQYGNLEIYSNMATEYNTAVKVYAVNGEDFTREQAELWENGAFTKDGVSYRYYQDDGENRIEVTQEDKYIFYSYSVDATPTRAYKIDVEKMEANAEVKAQLDALISAGENRNTACVKYFQNIGAKAAAEWFRTPENKPTFLWIKNVWYPDVAYEHPIQEYSKFKVSFTKDNVLSTEWEGAQNIDYVFNNGTDYDILTSELGAEKGQANGYFILIVVTIGLMLLSQFISMKSQKESNQYQTVDGQGARTQKMMMWMMPLIYAITGFMWTAAFSIYISVSSIIGIFVTLLSNLFIDGAFRKKEEDAIVKKYTRKLPWQQKQDEEKRGKKNK